WRAQHETEVAAGEHRERRGRMHHLVETEVLAVERDRGVDVVDDIADADCGHCVSPSSASRCTARGPAHRSAPWFRQAPAPGAIAPTPGPRWCLRAGT